MDNTIYSRFFSSLADGVTLTDFITHYEPLYYNQDNLDAQHHRSKRSVEDTLHLDLQAHGQ